MHLVRKKSTRKVSHGCFADVIPASSERAISAIINDEREHAAEKVGEFHSVLKQKIEVSLMNSDFCNCIELSQSYLRV